MVVRRDINGYKKREKNPRPAGSETFGVRYAIWGTYRSYLSEFIPFTVRWLSIVPDRTRQGSFSFQALYVAPLHNDYRVVEPVTLELNLE